VWFATFVGICAWAWSGRRRRDFARAARMALEADESEGGR